MGTFFAILGLLFLAAIPTENVLRWLLLRDLEEYQKGRPIPHVYFAKTPYVVFGSLGLDFLKGFGGVWAVSQVVGMDNWLALLLLPALLLAHYRSFFLKFHPRSCFMMIVGVYCAMNWPLGVSFALGFFVLSVLLNSFPTGLVSAVLFQFWCIWTSQLDPMFLLVNFTIFVLLIGIYHRQLFSHFEGKPVTILQMFEHR